MIIHISGKVSDMFSMSGDGIDYDGYVPSDMGIGGGDYISMSIDTETGQIQNWKPLAKKDITDSLSPDELEEEY